MKKTLAIGAIALVMVGMGTAGCMVEDDLETAGTTKVVEENFGKELPDCTEDQEEEDGKCQNPPLAEGVYLYFETEEYAVEMMPDWVPCWGDENAEQWVCWIEGATGAEVQG